MTVACSGGGSHAASDAAVDGTSPSGAPTLVALRVSGATDGLQPAFSPDVHDYSVRCSAGTNALKVSMTASQGALSALSMPNKSSAKAMQTVSANVPEGAAIVATATAAGKATTEYWVRCLPHDFPALTVTTYPDAGVPSAGYYLVGNAVVAVGERAYAMVLDAHGVPVWYHPLSEGLAVTDVESLKKGDVSFVPTSFVAYDPFEVVTLHPYSDAPIPPDDATTDEHELRLLPNGHHLVFSYPLKSGVDLTGIGVPKAFDGGVNELGPNSTIQDCEIVEFDEAGKVSWTWSATDHFDPAKVSTYPQTGFGPNSSAPDGGPAYDVYHCNAIDVDPANGNLLVSARGMDSVFYIDRSSGAVLWKMGGVNSSKDGATYVKVADAFFRQHDARLVAGWAQSCKGGAGQVSMFDDETGQVGPARAVAYDVVVGGGNSAGCGDAGAGTPGEAKVAWEYKGTNTSGGGGSVRAAADGGHVIGWGISEPVLTEVDAKGQKLIEVAFAAGDVSYRAIKVPLAELDLNALRASAGK
jgi:hypothetical protein